MTRAADSANGSVSPLHRKLSTVDGKIGVRYLSKNSAAAAILAELETRRRFWNGL
jgi:hypothetical protein